MPVGFTDSLSGLADLSNATGISLSGKKIEGRLEHWNTIMITEETKEGGRDECLSQVSLPRISCRQSFGGRQTWRVTD